MQILKLIAQGQGWTKIAETLGKGKSTISRQMTSLYSRLGTTNAKWAVRRGRELGLID